MILHPCCDFKESLKWENGSDASKGFVSALQNDEYAVDEAAVRITNIHAIMCIVVMFIFSRVSAFKTISKHGTVLAN